MKIEKDSIRYVLSSYSAVNGRWSLDIDHKIPFRVQFVHCPTMQLSLPSFNQQTIGSTATSLATWIQSLRSKLREHFSSNQMGYSFYIGLCFTNTFLGLNPFLIVRIRHQKSLHDCKQNKKVWWFFCYQKFTLTLKGASKFKEGEFFVSCLFC